MLNYMCNDHVLFKLIDGKITDEILGDGQFESLPCCVYEAVEEESLFLKLV